MNKFDIGDKVFSIYEPNKILTVISIDTIQYPYPVYTVEFEDGNKYANYGNIFKLAIREEDALRYGEVLTDDEFECDILDSTGFQIDETNYYRIRTVRYESRIFYHKMMNGEVVEFRELTT